MALNSPSSGVPAIPLPVLLRILMWATYREAILDATVIALSYDHQDAAQEIWQLGVESQNEET